MYVISVRNKDVAKCELKVSAVDCNVSLTILRIMKVKIGSVLVALIVFKIKLEVKLRRVVSLFEH